MSSPRGSKNLPARPCHVPLASMKPPRHAFARRTTLASNATCTDCGKPAVMVRGPTSFMNVLNTMTSLPGTSTIASPTSMPVGAGIEEPSDSVLQIASIWPPAVPPAMSSWITSSPSQNAGIRVRGRSEAGSLMKRCTQPGRRRSYTVVRLIVEMPGDL